jgi:prepilin-type N-terminal cleavage/methylation domain-containing protein
MPGALTAQGFMFFGIVVAVSRSIGMINRTRCMDRRGFSLIEMMFVVALTGVVAAIAVPMMANSLGYFRLSGDARSTANSIALAKMRAASIFGKVRFYADRSARSFRLETWNSATSTWVADTGSTYLSQGVTFNFGVVTTPPPNTQGTIAEAAACRDNAGVVVANTSCVIFNSRGIPIDGTATPSPLVDAVYVTDGTAVYGVAVSATGMVRTWRTPPTSTPTWIVQ